MDRFENRLASAGNIHRAEMARQLSLELLDALNELCDLAAQCLRAGEDCTADQKRIIEDRWTRILDLGKRIHDAIQ